MKALADSGTPMPTAAGRKRNKSREQRDEVGDASAVDSKRVKEEDYDDEDEQGDSKPTTDARQQAIDITAGFLQERLTPQIVTDVVLLTMVPLMAVNAARYCKELFQFLQVRLPENMPPSFQSSFTPIAAAGTEVSTATCKYEA